MNTQGFKQTMERLRTYYPLIRCICKKKSKKLREHFLTAISKDKSFCRCLREIAKHTVKEKFPLEKKHKKQLNKHVKTVRGVLSKNKRRRRLSVIQSGGFLPILLPFVAALLGEVVAKNVFSKNDS